MHLTKWRRPATLCFAMTPDTEVDALIREIRDSVAAAENILDIDDLPVSPSQKQIVEEFLATGAVRIADRLGQLNAAVQNIEELGERLDAERTKADRRLRQLLVLLQGVDVEAAREAERAVIDRLRARQRRLDAGPHEALDLSGKSIREAALHVLRRSKRPMYTAELVEALAAAGRPIEGNSSSILSASLSTGLAQTQFRAAKARGRNRWSLTEWEEEEGAEFDLESKS